MERSGIRMGKRAVPGGARVSVKYRQRAPGAQTRRCVTATMALLALRGTPVVGQSLSGPLVVWNAGSLARPFKELLDAFRQQQPGVVPAQENSSSLEAARKLTALGKIPDVLAVADYTVIGDVLMPKYAAWYANFARNAMVLAYTDQSRNAAGIDSTNWWRVVLTPGVRTGHSDPALDPNGYRTLIVVQLAERYYKQPGLARQLDLAMPPRFQRPKETDLTALLQTGELDYAWTYRSVAQSSGLRYVALPPAIDLSNPAMAKAYEAVNVRVLGARELGGDSLTLRGEPIVYALTIPLAAPHPEVALAFARFALSDSGRAILSRNGFTLLSAPQLIGTPPSGLVPAGSH